MAAAKTPVFSKYDFEALSVALGKLDSSGCYVEGDVWANDMKLTVRYDDSECIHEVTKIEVAE